MRGAVAGLGRQDAEWWFARGPLSFVGRSGLHLHGFVSPGNTEIAEGYLGCCGRQRRYHPHRLQIDLPRARQPCRRELAAGWESRHGKAADGLRVP